MKQLKKLIQREIDRILFQDESMIRDYQALAHTWFPKGQQKKIPTFGKHHGVKLIGILDYESGEVFCIEEEQYDAGVFLRFLEQAVARYPGEKIVINTCKDVITSSLTTCVVDYARDGVEGRSA
ncbi:transposase [Paenibacillus frigoriresistens]|nr:transposase [Paenibacillus frigoriresistens]